MLSRLSFFSIIMVCAGILSAGSFSQRGYHDYDPVYQQDWQNQNRYVKRDPRFHPNHNPRPYQGHVYYEDERRFEEPSPEALRAFKKETLEKFYTFLMAQRASFGDLTFEGLQEFFGDIVSSYINDPAVDDAQDEIVREAASELLTFIVNGKINLGYVLYERMNVAAKARFDAGARMDMKSLEAYKKALKNPLNSVTINPDDLHILMVQWGDVLSRQSGRKSDCENVDVCQRDHINIMKTALGDANLLRSANAHFDFENTVNNARFDVFAYIAGYFNGKINRDLINSGDLAAFSKMENFKRKSQQRSRDISAPFTISTKDDFSELSDVDHDADLVGHLSPLRAAVGMRMLLAQEKSNTYHGRLQSMMQSLQGLEKKLSKIAESGDVRPLQQHQFVRKALAQLNAQKYNLQFPAAKFVYDLVAPDYKARYEAGERVHMNALSAYKDLLSSGKSVDVTPAWVILLAVQMLDNAQSTCSVFGKCSQKLEDVLGSIQTTFTNVPTVQGDFDIISNQLQGALSVSNPFPAVFDVLFADATDAEVKEFRAKVVNKYGKDLTQDGLNVKRKEWQKNRYIPTKQKVYPWNVAGAPAAKTNTSQQGTESSSGGFLGFLGKFFG